MKPPLVLLAAALVSTSLHAQSGCPWERARTVPGSWTSGPLANCDSVLTFEFGGVAIRQQHAGCPLFVIVTPQHEVAERSDRATRARAFAQAPVTTLFFHCDHEYFLIFPIGSTCAYHDRAVTGGVDRMQTESCEVAPAPVATEAGPQ